MSRFGRLVAAATGVLLLAGCTTSDDESVATEPEYRAAWIQPLPDGRSVICIYASRGSGGGISCDWEGAK